MKETLDAIAQAIADELGEGWTPEPANYAHAGFVRGPSGMSLYVQGPGHAGTGRVGIHADAPRHPNVSFQPMPRVTVSATRDHGAIAKDVARRLMPKYSEAFTTASARIAEADDYTARQDKAHAAFIAASNGAARHLDGRESGHFYLNHSSGEASTYADGTVYEGSVSFQRLRVPLDKALKIAAILGEGFGS